MNSHFTKKLIAGAAVFCCAIGTASASIILTSNNTPYTQNFTGQTPGTLPGGWVTEVYHDGGSAGWRPTVENGSETPFNGGIRYFGADQVNSTALGFAAHSSWDALGDRDASFNWDVAAIASFTNSTGNVIDTLSIGYLAEQWRKGNFTGAQGQLSALNVFYRIEDGAWNSLSDMRFDAPERFGDEDAGSQLDPPVSELLSTTVSVLIDLDESFEIGWFYRGNDGGGGGERHHLSFTNVSVTAIPEPSTYAALAGLAGLLLVLRRRIKK